MTAHPQPRRSFRNQLKDQAPTTSLGRWTVALLGVHLTAMVIWTVME